MSNELYDHFWVLKTLIHKRYQRFCPHLILVPKSFWLVSFNFSSKMEGWSDESCSARSSNATVSIPALQGLVTKNLFSLAIPKLFYKWKDWRVQFFIKIAGRAACVSAEVESFLDEDLCVICGANRDVGSKIMADLFLVQSHAETLIAKRVARIVLF